MCRFPSKDDEGYRQVLGEIQILLNKIQKKKELEAPKKAHEIANVKAGSPSQMTAGSTAYCM